MPGRITRIPIGSRVRKWPSASWDTIADAVEEFQASDRTRPTPLPQQLTRRNVTVLLRNDSTEDLNAGGVLGVGDPTKEPSSSTPNNVELSQPMFAGHAPSSTYAGKFAIVASPVAAGGIREATVTGFAWVQVNVTDANHSYADVSGYTTKLASVSSAAGAAKIWWRESSAGTGDMWALVYIEPKTEIGPLTLIAVLEGGDEVPVAASPSEPSTLLCMESPKLTVYRVGFGGVEQVAQSSVVSPLYLANPYASHTLGPGTYTVLGCSEIGSLYSGTGGPKYLALSPTLGSLPDYSSLTPARVLGMLSSGSVAWVNPPDGSGVPDWVFDYETDPLESLELTDELVKVSSNDTDAKYAENVFADTGSYETGKDVLVNFETQNEGGNETLRCFVERQDIPSYASVGTDADSFGFVRLLNDKIEYEPIHGFDFDKAQVYYKDDSGDWHAIDVPTTSDDAWFGVCDGALGFHEFTPGLCTDPT